MLKVGLNLIQNVYIYQRLLATIGAKLVGPHGGLQGGKFGAFGAPISSSVLLSILLLAAIGSKLINPHGGLQWEQMSACHVAKLVSFIQLVKKKI